MTEFGLDELNEGTHDDVLAFLGTLREADAARP